MLHRMWIAIYPWLDSKNFDPAVTALSNAETKASTVELGHRMYKPTTVTA